MQRKECHSTAPKTPGAKAEKAGKLPARMLRTYPARCGTAAIWYYMRGVQIALIAVLAAIRASAEPLATPALPEAKLFEKITVSGIEIALGRTTLRELREAFGESAGIEQFDGTSRLCYVHGKSVVWFAAKGDETSSISAIGFEREDGGENAACGSSQLPLDKISLNAPTVGDSVAEIDAQFGLVRPDEQGNVQLTRAISTPAGKVIQTLIYALANARIVGLAAMQSAP
jgi:hypothetical protein